MKRVILSSRLLIETGSFQSMTITKDEAIDWLSNGEYANFCGHETVRILGVEPEKDRNQCDGYDEALVVSAKSRLEFGREYSVKEIEDVGVDFTLIKKVVSLDDILKLAEKLPSGLLDENALTKLVNEYDEFLEAVDEGDSPGSLTEAADAVYYAAKYLHFIACHFLDMSISDLMRVCQAKYTLRAIPGNPKNDDKERTACLSAIENY